jgi:hypothetical protein
LAAAGIVVTDQNAHQSAGFGGGEREHACDSGEETNNAGERVRLPDEARHWPLG